MQLTDIQVNPMNVSTLNLDGAAYHADTTYISKSGLDLIAKAPIHYWHRFLNKDFEPEEDNQALIIGRAVHCAVLEPHKFDTQFMRGPAAKKNEKGGKALWEEAQALAGDRELLRTSDWDEVQAIAAAIRHHPVANQLLSAGHAEKTFTWTDPDTGANCKMRTDWLSEAGYVVDLKTTTDASKEGFLRSVLNYRYHVQAAFYLDGLVANQAAPKGFVFIAIEKSAPYAVAVYHIDHRLIDKGRRAYKQDLATYVQCRETFGENQPWTSYNNGQAADLLMPAWMAAEDAKATV